MLTDIVLSRGMKIALSLLIVAVAVLLVWGLLSASGATGGNNAKPPAEPGRATSPPAGAGKTSEQPGTPAAQTLRQRSLR
ncbi:MAG: hypothetical protein ACTHK6_06670 [Solirubrobacterales bacterium]